MSSSDVIRREGMTYIADLPQGYDGRIRTTWFGGTMIITHPEKPPIYLGKDNKFHELKADRHG